MQDDAANDVALCDREVPGGGTQGVYEALMGNENRETVFYGFAFLCKGRLALGEQ